MLQKSFLCLYLSRECINTGIYCIFNIKWGFSLKCQGFFEFENFLLLLCKFREIDCDFRGNFAKIYDFIFAGLDEIVLNFANFKIISSKFRVSRYL